MTHSDALVAVLLGTDHHPFDRLVRWVSHLSDRGQTRWFVQYGATNLPDGLNGSSMLNPPALHDLLVRADAVVCHGGPGLIMEARALGHRPIVVARDPGLGEHVDDHQQRFLPFVSRRGLVTPASTQDELSWAIATALEADVRHSATATAGVAASARFGSLVDNLLQRP